MKLYTEDQLRKAWNTAYADALAIDDENYKPKFYIDFIASLTPIQIPTDEEIKKESHNYYFRGQLGFEAAADTERAFLRGVLWMRDKIKGGDK